MGSCAPTRASSSAASRSRTLPVVRPDGTPVTPKGANAGVAAERRAGGGSLMSAIFTPGLGTRPSPASGGSGYWRDLDWILLIAALAVTVFGSMLVWSASRADMASDSDPQSYLKRHLHQRGHRRRARASSPRASTTAGCAPTRRSSTGSRSSCCFLPFVPGIGRDDRRGARVDRPARRHDAAAVGVREGRRHPDDGRAAVGEARRRERAARPRRAARPARRGLPDPDHPRAERHRHRPHPRLGGAVDHRRVGRPHPMGRSGSSAAPSSASCWRSSSACSRSTRSSD